ncbi:MAG: methyltransferase type 11 [Deltaproteobacteria bacterium CG_4_8_14_3_um_filter_51_11]|nr:MAG: methyltransferase type 11 [Desulfobacteraceae bacterium CG2_30_51_40]PIX20164.1 MAG: methyltransferase type 11 [Deltaproteobacteria bacterium CG_4_8_14_3_um_filter_51_11]PIY26539.1 MAG: methyltransferase type 11 [Deltaproteobacteria bacterium CG_4_10_14_3_um_filter_51_14]
MNKFLLLKPGSRHVCPWWLAYTFDNPLRRLIHPPDKILGPYVAQGMSVLDFGCGFGHYSIGMALLTGPTGRVAAVDIQQKMLDKTMARAQKAGLENIIYPVLCHEDAIGIALELDFILACNSIHETTEPASFLAEFFGLLRPGGRFLLMEPRGHLSARDFDAEVSLALQAGFFEITRPKFFGQVCSLLLKPSANKDG